MGAFKETYKTIKNMWFYLLQWGIICTLIALIVGSVVAFFLYSLEKVTAFREHQPIVILFLPVVGVIFSYLYTHFGKNAGGGNNLVIRVAQGSEEEIPLRLVPLTIFGTIFTHLTGGSVGREGTATQSGGAIAYHVGRLFNLTDIEKQWVVMCGISAGFSAVFGTPLAGTLFAMEVLIIGEIQVGALAPVFFSAFLADIIAEQFPIHHAHYVMGKVPELSIKVVIALFICSICFGLVGFLFERSIQWVKSFYLHFTKNPVLINGIGGAVIVIFAMIFHTNRYLGLSLPMLSEQFTGDGHIFDFIGKLFFTALSLGSGFQGGEVTPLFGIGASLGSFLHQWIALPIGFMAAIGFVGVFAAATNTPITCFIMGIELFGSEAAPYLLFVTVFSYLFSGHNGIYASQRLNRPKYWVGENRFAFSQEDNQRVKDKLNKTK